MIEEPFKEDAYYETTQPYPVSGPCGHDALTLLTGCGGGKVTERAMEKAYGDYLRGQIGKPDLKVTYDVSPAVFEKIDGDLRANKASWFKDTGYLPTTLRASISMFPGTPAPLEPALPC